MAKSFRSMGVLYLFSPSALDGYLVYFHFFDLIKNNSAINIHVQVFVQTYVFDSLGYVPRTK